MPILAARPPLFKETSPQFLESERESLAGFRRAMSSAQGGNSAATSIVVFCAGGYRSRIFMSIVEAALMVVDADSSNSSGGIGGSSGGAPPPPSSRVTVGDVGRGAIELMSQHASVWQVKDRSIVCVS